MIAADFEPYMFVFNVPFLFFQKGAAGLKGNEGPNGPPGPAVSSDC